MFLPRKQSPGSLDLIWDAFFGLCPHIHHGRLVHRWVVHDWVFWGRIITCIRCIRLLSFFKYFSVKEAVRSLRALYWSNPASTHPCPWPRSSTSAQPGAVRPFPNKAIGVKSPNLSLTPCPSAPGWMPWMIPGPAPCLGVLGAANRPCGTGTTEEEWDSVGSCSAPQPQ